MEHEFEFEDFSSPGFSDGEPAEYYEEDFTSFEGIEQDFSDDFTDDFTDDFSLPEINDVEPDLEADLEEDLRLVNELREKVGSLGYSKLEDLEYSELEQLLKRDTTYNDEDKLRKFIEPQKDLLKRTEESMSDVQATYIGGGASNRSQLDKVTSFSADSTLGPAATQLISSWVRQQIRITPNASADEMFTMLRDNSSGFLSRFEIISREEEIRNFIATILPIVEHTVRTNVLHGNRDRASREKMSQYLMADERSNTESLLSSERLALIKTVYEDGSGVFSTVCPVCGSVVHIEKPVVRFVTFVTEGAPDKSIFIEKISCECGASLLFTPDEYGAETIPIW